MGWDGPILTDSGGFQVLQPRQAAGISARRAWSSAPTSTARSALLTPERCVEIQQRAGRRHHPSARRVPARIPATARRDRALAGAHAAVAGALGGRARPRPAEAEALFGIVQGGIVSSAATASRRGGRWRWTCPATPSAGSAVGEPQAARCTSIAELTARAPADDRPALPDGRGQADRPGGGGGARRGPLRLRAAHAQRDATGRPSRGDGPLDDQQRAFARDPAPLDAGVRVRSVSRLLAGVPATPLHGARAPRLSACSPSTTSPSICVSCAAMRAAIAEGALGAFRARFLERYGVESAARLRRRYDRHGGLSFMVDLAYAMAPPPGGSGNGGGIMSILPADGRHVRHHVLPRSSGPSRSRRSERESLLAAIKKGDRVVTVERPPRHGRRA